jgi:penicillin amidase
MPKVQNPQQGYLVNWNNNPAKNFPNLEPRAWKWGPSHRVDTLDARVRAAVAEGPVSPERLQELHRDVATIDVYAHHVVPGLLALAGPGNEATRAIAAWADAGYPLRDDDRDGRVDHEGVLVFETWREILQEAIFGDELGAANMKFGWGSDLLAGENYDDHGDSRRWSESVLATLLASRTRTDWWDDVRTPQREDATTIVTRTTGQLLERLPSPGSMEEWKRAAVTVHYVPTGLLPAMSMPHQNRGSINYLVDFAKGSTETILPPGQSGHVTLAQARGGAPDARWNDQIGPYVEFDFKRYG